MPDLPGYGRSERPADFSYSVRDEASVVIGFMDALERMERRPSQISVLPVTDAAGLALGLLRIHDIFLGSTRS